MILPIICSLFPESARCRAGCNFLEITLIVKWGLIFAFQALQRIKSIFALATTTMAGRSPDLPTGSPSALR